MATLSTQVIKRAGLNATLAAATGGGDRFTPNGSTFLEVNNGSGGALTVTVAATGKVDGDLSVGNVVVSVGAGVRMRIGPFPADQFLAADGSGLADITYSGVTSLTIAAIQLQQP